MADRLAMAAVAARFSAFSTVQHYFYGWRDCGVVGADQFRLLLQAREAAGREPSLVGWGDRQPIGRTTASGGPRGFDAGKKINGRKRHVITDTTGLLVAAEVHPADMQDRDGAPALLAAIRYLFPWLRHLFADGGYAGEKLAETLARQFGSGRSRSSSVADRSAGFERLAATLGGRALFRLAQSQPPPRQNFEGTIASAKAWLYQAAAFLALGDGRTASPTGHLVNGRELYNCTDVFAAYPSLGDCFIDHARLIASGGPYAAAWAAFHLPNGSYSEFVLAIGKVYATNPTYGETILSFSLSSIIQNALAEVSA